MTDNDRYKVPKPNDRDTKYTIIRAMLGSIPHLGAAASELFGLVVTPSIEKRRDEWMENIAEDVQKLKEQKAITIEDLSQNKAFINAILQASRSALLTDQKEKLKAPKNAVINSALSTSPDEDTQQIFLHFVDTFTQWHLKILKFLRDPANCGIALRTGYPYIHLSALGRALEQNHPELTGRSDFYSLILKDLSDRGLLNMSAIDNTHGMATMEGIPSAQVTEFGAKFLSFIESQFDDDE